MCVCADLQTSGMEGTLLGTETVGRDQARFLGRNAEGRSNHHRATGRTEQGCLAGGSKHRCQPKDHYRQITVYTII